MLTILADSFLRASYQHRDPKPRWDMPAHQRERHHYAPKTPSKEPHND